MANWSLARRAAQLIVAPIASGDPAAIAVATSAQVGGLLLLGATPAGPQLAAALSAPVHDAEAPPPFVMADQEGGGVQRLGAAVSSIPWPRDMARTSTPSQVAQLATSVARQMKALHIDVDLAPVLDLDAGPGPSASDPDGRRSFSADPSVASRYGVAFADGLQAGGVMAVAKHFPGLGGATGNTDFGAADTRPLFSLRTSGLIPFQAAVASGVRAVMVANASVPGMTGQPASVSGAVVGGLLRGELHFSGLVMTDSLSAGAIKDAGLTVPSASVAAVKAGSDMVLFGSTLTEADRRMLAPLPLRDSISAIDGALVQAVEEGALPESRLDDAVGHVLAAKGFDLCSR